MASRKVPIVLHIDEAMLRDAAARARVSVEVLNHELDILRRRSRLRRLISFGLWR